MTAARTRAGGPGGGALRDTLARVDHVVYATRDLEAEVEHLAAMLGVRASPGGRHPAWSTRNALIALGERVYLEIVAPDPDGPEPDGSRPFGLDTLAAARLATWCVVATDLERIARDARAHGVDLGPVQHRSRQRPDDTVLRWTMTDPTRPRADGLVPFYIDWGDAPHPAASAPSGGRLAGLRARHPEPGRVRTMLRALGLAMEVASGDAPELIATIETDRGPIELR